jgi:ribosomal protein S18 acetylase RimI-like enzyme
MSLFADYKKERERKDVLETEKGFAVYWFPDNQTCYLEEIYVAPFFRKQGYATELANQVEEIACMHGCIKMVGSVATNVEHKHASLLVVLSHGYRLADAKDNMVYFVKEL